MCRRIIETKLRYTKLTGPDNDLIYFIPLRTPWDVYGWITKTLTREKGLQVITSRICTSLWTLGLENHLKIPTRTGRNEGGP